MDLLYLVFVELTQLFVIFVFISFSVVLFQSFNCQSVIGDQESAFIWLVEYSFLISYIALFGPEKCNIALI